MSSHFNRVEEEDSSLEDEVSSVRSMKVAEIKLELSQRGLATDDMFEKEEFVRRLAQAAWTRFRATNCATSASTDLSQLEGEIYRN